MIEGIDLNLRVEFVSKDDKADPKTVFVLRPLSGSEKINLSGFYSRGKLSLTGSYLLDVLRKCVVETKNPDLKNEELGEYLERLPSDIIVELGEKITDLVDVTDDERKNSSLP